MTNQGSGSHMRIPHAIFDRDGKEVGFTRKRSYKACHKNFKRQTGIPVWNLSSHGFSIQPVEAQP